MTCVWNSLSTQNRNSAIPLSETTFAEITGKYMGINVMYPFMEGNRRSTRTCPNLMLRRSLKLCVDWS